MHVTMEELLYRIQFHDDQLAFKALYQQQVFRLYQFAFAFVKQRQPAEEIVNDVFVKLWQKRHQLDKIGQIRVYLYVAVKNAALNQLRRPAIFTETDLDSLHVQHFRLEPDTEQLLLTHELQQAIASAVEQLPPKCKMIFKLVKQDELSYKEVAGILGISPKTVDAQLAIAMKKLAARLQCFAPVPALPDAGEKND
ncbi:RNA polymerase sigma-70 factor (ECF subfamily) [Chitinophaga polysaccharea]|uniref:RNA polymerase sigma-70 factor (ECF subfamily) n=1 Tax=Chitinophaga polysaccharea TaxID=1293035 RepID=A0A561PP06_9BACT|nr:RNA polymerase sigma-70 factor [Chitinophaga polysaccharea]TWF39840.1 RNA polymerase sigma-70 factor (ECF subfamily) [Chitinophaga polysaccharea]